MPRKKHFNKRFIFILAVVLIIAGAVTILHKDNAHSLVPKKIQRSVSFQIYYPSPKELPTGYVLDTKSFHLAQPGVVLFAVTHGSKNIVFSEEQQPSSNDMDKFISNYIPINSQLELPLGQARMGAYGTAPNIRTVVSLPIARGPWLIVTAPSSINQNDLSSILQNLTK